MTMPIPSSAAARSAGPLLMRRLPLTSMARPPNRQSSGSAAWAKSRQLCMARSAGLPGVPCAAR